jgi:hypothetical protein
MGDHTERKGTTASKIPKSSQCSYNTNFTSAVIKNTEETKNCTTAQKLCHGKECTTLEKQTISIRSKFNQETFCGPKQRNFNATYEEALEFVLRKHKTILFVTRAMV